MACGPDSGMMDAVFSIVCLKVRFIDLLLLCIVDGSVLQETKVPLIGCNHLNEVRLIALKTQEAKTEVKPCQRTFIFLTI